MFQDYIKPELLVLIPVLYFIGIGLKKSKVKDRLIPVLLGSISVILTFIYVLSTTAIGSAQDFAALTFVSLTQGVLIAAASVYANQIYKQYNKKE